MEFKGHESHEVEKEIDPQDNSEWWLCHTCRCAIGRVTEVYSRIVGYLRPVSAWNAGKRAEYGKRKTYGVEP